MKLLNRFVIFISCLFIVLNVYADDVNVSLNDLSYGNYLNMYNLQYDDREIAQRYYKFLMEHNLLDYVTGHFTEGTCYSDCWFSSYGSGQYDYVISILGLNAPENNEYDLSSGINFNIYVNYRSPGDSDWSSYKDNFIKYSYIKTVGDSTRLLIKASSYYRIFKFNLFIDDDNNATISKIHSFQGYSTNSIVDITLDNPIQFLTAFYQSNFVLNYSGSSSSNRNVYFNNIHFYDSLDTYYTSSDYEYLGYKYFDKKPVYGSGVPLYPGIAYFTNSFKYGSPYTNDYDSIIYNNNQKCYFSPTQSLINNYDNYHTNGYDKFWLISQDLSDGSLFPDLTAFSISDTSYLSSSYTYTIDNNIIKKYTYSSLKVNDEFAFILPELIDLNSIYILDSLSTDIDLSIYFRKDLWNYTCVTAGNYFSLTMSDGSTLTGSSSSIIDNTISDSGRNLLNFIIPNESQLNELLKESQKLSDNFGFIGQSVNFSYKLFSSFTNITQSTGCINFPDFTLDFTKFEPIGTKITLLENTNICLADNEWFGEETDNIKIVRIVTTISLVILFLNFCYKAFFNVLSKETYSSDSSDND